MFALQTLVDIVTLGELPPLKPVLTNAAKRSLCVNALLIGCMAIVEILLAFVDIETPKSIAGIPGSAGALIATPC